jgi:transcriptional repressor NrdR
VKCPFCGASRDRVVDSRDSHQGEAIRRRRECLECTRRFTTYERVEDLPVMVIKKDQRREAFDRQKLLSGLLKACEKRPVPLPALENLVDEIMASAGDSADREIPTTVVGEMVMERLRELDGVAYVRFASVYRDFRDVGAFMEELESLVLRQKKRAVAPAAKESPEPGAPPEGEGGKE